MPVKLNLASEQKNADNNFWNGSPANPYSDNNIIEITDEAADVEIPVTSIPSPFAQMHLFETAFEFINHTQSFEGNSVYNRLVSYCLDVFELLFNSDELEISSHISGVSWSVSELKEFSKNNPSVSEGLSMFIETLDLYIRNYNSISRFSRDVNPFNRLTILSYNGEVFAGTSPFTGFFTTGNPISIPVRSFDNREFFNKPSPLYRRGSEYIKFMNLFLASNQSIISAFKQLHDYVRYCRVFNPDLIDFFRQVDNENISEKLRHYPEFKFGNSPLYLLPGIAYRKKRVSGSPPEESDYRIKSRKTLDKKPLVLPMGTRNTSLKYLNTTLPEDLSLPTQVSTDYNERILPGTQNLKYPFIVRNDFLSKYLVELNYPINSASFFTGYSENFKKGYLIPVKSDYFKFFTVDDLKENLEINILSTGAICVKLQIPIMGEDGKEKITFERTYNELKNPENISSENNGAIIPLNFYMGFYPFFKVGGNQGNLYNDFYKTFIYFDSNIHMDALFLRNKLDSDTYEIIQHNKTTRTRREEDLNFVSDYYDISKNFEEREKDITYDLLELKIKPYKDKSIIIDTVLVPKFETIQITNDETYLSFDIGTTNTFIAYAINKNKPQALNTEYKNDQGIYGRQLVMLHSPVDGNEFEGSDRYDFNSRRGLRLLPFQMNEFLPSIVGNNSKYRYPMNTVIYYDNDLDLENREAVKVLSNINIPFAYGIWRSRGVDRMSTNLKWDVSDEQNQIAKIKLKSYIKESVLIARNKILLEGRNPKKCTVIWFKPLSMGKGISNVFSETWDDLYMTYFLKEKKYDETKRIRMMSESMAPFYELATDNLGDYFLNIDVGGGTSDIVVYDRKDVVLSNSFRFAGNAIFGNGLDPRRLGKENGIAKKYYEILIKILEKSNKEKAHILNNIRDSDDLKSEDMINFFFTIPEFKEMIKADQDLKLLFILHNAALFYHSAQIMKSKGLNTPKFIGLSGNGSKLFEITNGSPELNAKNSGLIELVNTIFSYVYEKDSLEQPISFKFSSNPKESTAFGGIKGINQSYDDEDVHSVFLGDSSTLFDYRIAKNRAYSDLMQDNDVIESVKNNYLEFINLFFDKLWYDCDFKDSFVLNPAFVPKKIKESLINEKDIKDYILNGLDYRIQDNDTVLTETLFFYPLIASIYYLSQQLTSEEINEFK